MKDDRVYLEHILECVRRIEENVAGGREAFLRSHTLQDATLRNPHTMTESTQRLSPALKQRHPDAEWPRIAAFRNVVVHDYLRVDLERIWDVVQRDIPRLKSAVSTMLQEVP